MTKKYIQILIISLVLLASFGCGKKEEYREFKSPDGKYKIIVFYHPSWFAVSPGQAGDNPGTIQLQDERGKNGSTCRQCGMAGQKSLHKIVGRLGSA